MTATPAPAMASAPTDCLTGHARAFSSSGE
jgi:hypothetical protein